MLEKTTLIILFTAMFILLAYLDKRFCLGLMQDQGENKDSQSPKQNKIEQDNRELRDRIETLERIVTEPKYDLAREINSLS